MIKNVACTLWIWCIVSVFSFGQRHNQLTKAEKKEGWKLLFDGKTSKGWRGGYSPEFPKQGWMIEKGTLTGKLDGGGESVKAGDIISVDKFKNFDLVFDWKLDSGGNSGVKYFVLEEPSRPDKKASLIGYEYQLIDDTNFRIKGEPLGGRFKTGALYEVIPPDKPDVVVGVWHTSRIRVNNENIEHWLNGKKVMEVNRKTGRFTKGVADGKFRDHPGFATIPEGHILLQDHGSAVSFRNIKIKEL